MDTGQTMRAWERDDRARKGVRTSLGGMEALRGILDRVVVEPTPAPMITAGGIHIPDAHADETGRGIVVAKGPGNPARGGSAAMQGVDVGDIVLFGRRAGVPVNYADGSHVFILSVYDLVAVIDHVETPCPVCGRAETGNVAVGSVALFD